ncbi:MAG: glycosyltransferase family 2 protein [Roseobacter sp.]
MKTAQRWGVCATVKAPAKDILKFAAHYLDAGAHRVWIYLDVPEPGAFDALKAHPKCRVIECDAVYWRRVFGRRPKRHQVRQTQNATRTYSKAGEVDWLLHADVDEFLVSEHRVADALSGLPFDTVTARVRPMEALAPVGPDEPPTAYKMFIPPGPDRQKRVRDIYPQFGAFLGGGFLSHLAGKVFVRTNQPDITLRIHNSAQGDQRNPNQVEMPQFSLAHLHAADWDAWRTHFTYRLTQGAYRSELRATQPRDQSGVTLHEFFTTLIAEKGEAGLRDFFEEVCMDSPALRAKLADHGLLMEHDLQLEAKLKQHFTDLTL